MEEKSRTSCKCGSRTLRDDSAAITDKAWCYHTRDACWPRERPSIATDEEWNEVLAERLKVGWSKL